MLARLQVRYQPVRDQDVNVGVSLRGDGAGGPYGAVRHQCNAQHRVIDFYRIVVYLKAVGRVGVHQVRVLQRCSRSAQARRLVVAGSDEVGDVGVERDAGRLLQEADDHVRRRAHRVKDVAGVNDKVNVSLQNGVYRPPIRLLYVHLPLVASCPRAQPRVPRVP